MKLPDFFINPEFVLCERHDSVCVRHKLIKLDQLEDDHGILYEKGTSLDWKIIAECEIILKNS